jgi:single-strand DNA-binding protein
MARGFNQVILLGNLTQDPELRTIPSGQAVCSFSLAVNRSWTGKDGQAQDAVDYFDCVAWGKPGEIISQYMGKGRRLFVSGRLQNRSWDAKDGTKRYKTEVVVTDFNFVDSGGNASGSNSAPSNAQTSSNNSNKEKDVVIEDLDSNQPIDLSDIPF